MADQPALKDPTSGRAWYTFLAEGPGGVTRVQVDANGYLITSLASGSTITSTSAAQNTSVSVMASAAHTSDQTQADQTNTTYKGLHLIVNVTSAGTGSITPKIQGKGFYGNYYDLLVGTAITSTGINVLKLYPGLTASANAVANDVLPHDWRVVITHNNANSMTYSASAQLLI